MKANPSELGSLLSDLLKRNPDLRPTIGHLDSIMAEAVKLASTPKYASDVQGSSTWDTLDPAAGLIPLGDFDEAIRDIIQSLRDRGIRSGSKSLANRLRFEAMSGVTIDGVPSARIVWNELVSRGYKPDHRHLLALMHGYANADSMNAAEDVIKLARQTDNPITRGMLMVLLTGWGKRGEPSRSEHAYESIRRLGGDHRGEGLDIVAVTAMIKAFLRNGNFEAAVEVIRTDLPALNQDLDDIAISVASAALMWYQDYSAALNLIRSNGDAMNFVHRRIVRKIRVRLQRKMARGQATKDDFATLELVNRTLQRDDEVRPVDSRTRLMKGDGQRLETEKREIIELFGEEHGDEGEDNAAVAKQDWARIAGRIQAVGVENTTRDAGWTRSIPDGDKHQSTASDLSGGMREGMSYHSDETSAAMDSADTKTLKVNPATRVQSTRFGENRDERERAEDRKYRPS